MGAGIEKRTSRCLAEGLQRVAPLAYVSEVYHGIRNRSLPHTHGYKSCGKWARRNEERQSSGDGCLTMNTGRSGVFPRTRCSFANSEERVFTYSREGERGSERVTKRAGKELISQDVTVSWHWPLAPRSQGGAKEKRNRVLGTI